MQLYPFSRYTSFLSFKLFPSVRPLLSFQLFPFIIFFQILWGGATQTKQLLAATCDHFRPPLAATSGHLRALVATCSSGHLWPLPATCSHLLQLRTLAATCNHLRPLECLQVAASGCHALALRDPLRPAATCGHLRPLAATCACSNSPPAATCSHLRPLEWLRVAASGCVFEIQIARVLQTALRILSLFRDQPNCLSQWREASAQSPCECHQELLHRVTPPLAYFSWTSRHGP